MISIWLNILLFLGTTLSFFYFIKDKNDEIQTTYNKVGIYFILVLIGQFLLNAWSLAEMCGGSVQTNFANAGIITLTNWTLLFGALLAMVAFFPSIKSVFADVIGYAYVSSSVNTLFSEMLLNSSTEELSDTADMVMKIMGNKSLLVNQITTENFEQYWQTLAHLVKQNEYKDSYKGHLLEVVRTRENVGEAMWYIYGGFALICLVQLKLASVGCSNKSTMQANYAKFQEQEAQAQKEKEAKTDQIYTITS